MTIWSQILMKLTVKNVENSGFYAGMRLGLRPNVTIQNHLFQLLGSHSHVQIGDIEIYDPVMSPADSIVFKELSLKVLTDDENCKWKAQRPTMFDMPSPCYYLLGNLLGADWSSSSLNLIFLLTNLLADTSNNLPFSDQNTLETKQRLLRILYFATEIAMNTSDHQMYASFFPGFAWHFFDVGRNIDMGKPECYWLDMQGYLDVRLDTELSICYKKNTALYFCSIYTGTKVLPIVSVMERS